MQLCSGIIRFVSGAFVSLEGWRNWTFIFWFSLSARKNCEKCGSEFVSGRA